MLKISSTIASLLRIALPFSCKYLTYNIIIAKVYLAYLADRYSIFYSAFEIKFGVVKFDIKDRTLN
jgi:hypothetical protein